MLKELKLFITGRTLPFTETSGNRPVLFDYFNENSKENYDVLIRNFMNFWGFYEVDSFNYKFNRDTQLTASLRVSSNIITNKQLNYVIILADGEYLLYFIKKSKLLQNNVYQFQLKLDTISTYFWKINSYTTFGVERLNYNINDRDNFWLLNETLSKKDNSIGEITKPFIVAQKPRTPLELIPYSFRQYTSKQLETINDYPKNFVDNGYITTQENTTTLRDEDNSNTIYYNFLHPKHETQILHTLDGLHEVILNSVKVISVVADLASDFKWTDAPIAMFFGAIPYLFNRLIHGAVKVVYKFTFTIVCKTHNRVETLTNKIASPVSLDGFLNNENNKHIVKLLISKPFYPPFVLDNSKLSEIRKTDDNYFPSYITPYFNDKVISEHTLPKIFDRIPMISEIADISLTSWTGDTFKLSPLDIWQDLSYMNFHIYRYNTDEDFLTNITLNTSRTSVSESMINNTFTIKNHIQLSQRYDSKQEFLSSNSNRINLQIRTAIDNFIQDNVKGAGKIASGVAGGDLSKGAGSIIDGATDILFAPINFANKLRSIQSNIDDIASSRSKFKGVKDNLLLATDPKNTRFFNKYGLALILKLPSREMWLKLLNHFYKFGQQVDIYMTLRQIFFFTRDKKFTYFKCFDISALYNYNNELSEEILSDMTNILNNGIHFWAYNVEPDFKLQELKRHDLNNTYFAGEGNAIREEVELYR